MRALRELPDRRLGYANHRGVAELRNAVAGYLARVRGVVPTGVVMTAERRSALIRWAREESELRTATGLLGEAMV